MGITLASSGNAQGVIVTADNMDASDVLSGNLRYFGGPLGSASGGYLALKEYGSLALAQASPFVIPIDGRVDFPTIVQARYVRLYHRSTDASAHTIREFMPRRLVQADDIEAESIKAINISAGAITAEKISVLKLSAITASMGSLHMDGPIDITTGSLTGGGTVVTLDATGLGFTGPTFSYALTNLSPVTPPRANMAQWSKTSGSQEASIVGSNSAQLLMLADQITLAVPLTSTVSAGIDISGSTVLIENCDLAVRGDNIGSADFEVNTALSASSSSTYVRGGLNVGTATGAGTGQIGTSGSVGAGIAAQSNVRLFTKGQDSTSSNYALFVQDSGGNTLAYVRNDGAAIVNKAGAALGFYGSGGTTKPTVTGSRGANAALASLLTALANLGLLVDSST